MATVSTRVDLIWLIKDKLSSFAELQPVDVPYKHNYDRVSLDDVQGRDNCYIVGLIEKLYQIIDRRNGLCTRKIMLREVNENGEKMKLFAVFFYNEYAHASSDVLQAGHYLIIPNPVTVYSYIHNAVRNDDVHLVDVKVSQIQPVPIIVAEMQQTTLLPLSNPLNIEAKTHVYTDIKEIAEEDCVNVYACITSVVKNYEETGYDEYRFHAVVTLQDTSSDWQTAELLLHVLSSDPKLVFEVGDIVRIHEAVSRSWHSQTDIGVPNEDTIILVDGQVGKPYNIRSTISGFSFTDKDAAKVEELRTWIKNKKILEDHPVFELKDISKAESFKLYCQIVRIQADPMGVWLRVRDGTSTDPFTYFQEACCSQDSEEKQFSSGNLYVDVLVTVNEDVANLKELYFVCLAGVKAIPHFKEDSYIHYLELRLEAPFGSLRRLPSHHDKAKLISRRFPESSQREKIAIVSPLIDLRSETSTKETQQRQPITSTPIPGCSQESMKRNSPHLDSIDKNFDSLQSGETSCEITRDEFPKTREKRSDDQVPSESSRENANFVQDETMMSCESESSQESRSDSERNSNLDGENTTFLERLILEDNDNNGNVEKTSSANVEEGKGREAGSGASLEANKWSRCYAEILEEDTTSSTVEGSSSVAADPFVGNSEREGAWSPLASFHSPNSNLFTSISEKFPTRDRTVLEPSIENAQNNNPEFPRRNFIPSKTIDFYSCIVEDYDFLDSTSDKLTEDEVAHYIPESETQSNDNKDTRHSESQEIQEGSDNDGANVEEGSEDNVEPMCIAGTSETEMQANTEHLCRKSSDPPNPSPSPKQTTSLSKLHQSQSRPLSISTKMILNRLWKHFSQKGENKITPSGSKRKNDPWDGWQEEQENEERIKRMCLEEGILVEPDLDVSFFGERLPKNDVVREKNGVESRTRQKINRICELRVKTDVKIQNLPLSSFSEMQHHPLPCKFRVRAQVLRMTPDPYQQPHHYFMVGVCVKCGAVYGFKQLRTLKQRKKYMCQKCATERLKLTWHFQIDLRDENEETLKVFAAGDCMDSILGASVEEALEDIHLMYRITNHLRDLVKRPSCDMVLLGMADATTDQPEYQVYKWEPLLQHSSPLYRSEKNSSSNSVSLLSTIIHD